MQWLRINECYTCLTQTTIHNKNAVNICPSNVAKRQQFKQNTVKYHLGWLPLVYRILCTAQDNVQSPLIAQQPHLVPLPTSNTFYPIVNSIILPSKAANNVQTTFLTLYMLINQFSK